MFFPNAPPHLPHLLTATISPVFRSVTFGLLNVESPLIFKKDYDSMPSSLFVVQNTVSTSINPTNDSNSHFTAFLLQYPLPPTITSLFEQEMAFLGDTEHSIPGSWSITIP